MITTISLLRAVNVGGRNKIKMEELRSVYESLGLISPSTHIQSGNVVFGAPAKGLNTLSKRIADAIEQSFGVRSEVILRSVTEMRDVIARNPFSTRTDIPPNKLHVAFLATDPGPEAFDNIRKLQPHPDELHLIGRELYIHFPNGAGQAKLPPAAIDRALKTPATARNWNTVTKLLEIAENWEAARMSRKGSS